MCKKETTISCWVLYGDPSRSRCIHQKYICDGQNDCFNGDSISDEFGCREYSHNIIYIFIIILIFTSFPLINAYLLLFDNY